jgi:lantibiotic biosynthesis protein
VKDAFKDSGFFVLRAPLLPFDEILRWAEVGEGTAAGYRRWIEHAVAATGRPEVHEGLRLASQSLMQALHGVAEKGEEVPRRLALSIVRYLCRMAARPTPFGLLAGYSVGTTGAPSALDLGGGEALRRSSHVAIQHLEQLCDRLAADPAVLQAVALLPNSSLYAVAGQWRYVEVGTAAQEGGEYTLQAVRDTPELRAVLDAAVDGPTLDTLVARAAAALEAPAEAVAPYVGQLVDNQILVPAVAPPVTGEEPLDALYHKVELLPAPEIRQGLGALRQALGELDEQGPGLPSGAYRSLESHAAALFPEVPLDVLLHVESRREVPHLSLPEAVTDAFTTGVGILHRLFGEQDDAVATFRDRFLERYEGRFVPLAEALDDELGVGFSGFGQDAADLLPLLQDLRFPGAPEAVPWLPCHRAIVPKLARVLAEGGEEIELSAADLEVMACREPLPLPDALAAVGSVAAASAEAIDGGDFRVYLYSVIGPSGVRLLGRFCQSDAVLERWVRKHIAQEEALRPDALFAEVVNLPRGRSGNIVTRPTLRRYEIPYLGESGVPVEQQIPVADLLVGVRERRVVLWSRRLDQEVLPRLTTAHNYRSHGVATYRFLAALQRHRAASALCWDWGPLTEAPFLPRVRSGRVVLSPATWMVRRQELEALRHGSFPARRQAVEAFREHRRLPRFTVLVDGDQHLLVDWHNLATVDACVALTGSRESWIFQELMPGAGDFPVTGEGQRFAHQVVLPLVRRERRPAPSMRPPETFAMVDRIVPPRGEWLSLKLYTGYSTADRLLIETVAPLAREWVQAGGLRGWFFVRFNDPEFHLRVRFHGDGEMLWNRFYPDLSQRLAPLLHDGWLARVQVDTYVRELERYGGLEGTALSEQIFSLDSEITVALLPLVREDPELRWRLAAYSSEALLEDFGCAGDEQRELLGRLAALYGHEFHLDRSLRQDLARKVRSTRAELLTLDEAAARAPWAAAYSARRQRLAPLVKALRGVLATRGDDVRWREIFASHLHMHLNRWFRSSPRAQEMVLYDLLHRRALSRHARRQQGVREEQRVKI